MANGGRALVGGNHPWLRDGLTLAFAFQGTQLQVEQNIPGEITKAETGTGRGGRAQVHRQSALGTVEPSWVDVTRHELPSIAFHEASRAGDAPVHAQLPGSGVSGYHDTRLDLHLAHGHIQPVQSTHDVAYLFRGILNEQRIGALVYADTAAVGQQAKSVTATQQLRQVLCPRILDFDEFGNQRGLGLLLVARLDLLPLQVGQLVGGGHHDDIALLTAGEPLALQDQRQRLIPGYVVQVQGDAPRHAVAGHQVQAGKLGQRRQHGTHFDILEVETQALASERLPFALALLLRRLAGRLDLDGQRAATLRGQHGVRALRLQLQQRVTLPGTGRDAGNRRSKIGDIVNLVQGIGDVHVTQFGNHAPPTAFSHLRDDTVTVEGHQQAPRAIRTPAEVDVTDLRALSGCQASLGRGIRRERNPQPVAVDP